jgi:hypothetical protein
MTIQSQTERVLHDFVCEAVSHLFATQRALRPEIEYDTRWERGADGHFRERKKRMQTSWSMLSDKWLRSLPDYQTCVEYLKSDVVVGPHLDRLVGTSMSALRLEANDILKSLMYAMLDDEGRLAFTDERFHSSWQELVGFFSADRITYKMVSPLPPYSQSQTRSEHHE